LISSRRSLPRSSGHRCAIRPTKKPLRPSSKTQGDARHAETTAPRSTILVNLSVSLGSTRRRRELRRRPACRRLRARSRGAGSAVEDLRHVFACGRRDEQASVHVDWAGHSDVHAIGVLGRLQGDHGGSPLRAQASASPTTCRRRTTEESAVRFSPRCLCRRGRDRTGSDAATAIVSTASGVDRTTRDEERRASPSRRRDGCRRSPFGPLRSDADELAVRAHREALQGVVHA